MSNYYYNRLLVDLVVSLLLLTCCLTLLLSLVHGVGGSEEPAQQEDGMQMFWCRNSNCSEPISFGKTLVKYSASTHRHLSFTTKQPIVIIAKPVGNGGPSWVGQVSSNGKVGLIPINLMREDRVLKGNEEHTMTLDIVLLMANGNQITIPETVKQTNEEIAIESGSEQNSQEIEVSDTQFDAGTAGVEDADQPVTELVDEFPSTSDNEQKNNSVEAVDDDKLLEVKEEHAMPFDNTILMGNDSENSVPDTAIQTNEETMIESGSEQNYHEIEVSETQFDAAGVEDADQPVTELVDEFPSTFDNEQKKHSVEAVDDDKLLEGKEEHAMPFDNTTLMGNDSQNNSVPDTAIQTNEETTIESGSEQNYHEIEVSETQFDAGTAGVEDADQPVTELVDEFPSTFDNEQKNNSVEAVHDDKLLEGKEEHAMPFDNTILMGNDSQNTIPDTAIQTNEETTIETGSEQNYQEIEVSETQFDADTAGVEDADQPVTELVDEFPSTSDNEQKNNSVEAVDDDKLLEGKEKHAMPFDNTILMGNDSQNTIPDTAIQTNAETTIESGSEQNYHEIEVSETPFDAGAASVEDEDEPTESVVSIVDDFPATDDNEQKNNSMETVVKYLSSRLLSFLPEHLQDTIRDANDAFLIAGTICLMIISLCVPYFFFETIVSTRPLKKKVVDLNKSLWKVSAAYENQQEEFEVFKKKAFAYDEVHKKTEHLELQLDLSKKMDQKQKEQIASLKQQLGKHKNVEKEVSELVDKTLKDLEKTEKEKQAVTTELISYKSALESKIKELSEVESELQIKSMDLELLNHSKEHLENKISVTENEIFELKSKLNSEINLRREIQDTIDQMQRGKESLQEELKNLKSIAHQYEETVNTLTTEISIKETELDALKESLGEDSPLVEVAEIKAKLTVAEEESKSLQARFESITLENSSLSKKFEAANSLLTTIKGEKEYLETQLKVLESYWKNEENDYKKRIDKLEVEQALRGKDKNELIEQVHEKIDTINDLNQRIDEMKQEFEETKGAYKSEVKILEQKNHENWLAICRAEKQAKNAKDEADTLRQKLTAIARDHQNLFEADELNLIAPLPMDLVPPPLPMDAISPSYYGLGPDFMPPPPLPLDGEEEVNHRVVSSTPTIRAVGEPHRPPPVGRISPNDSDSEMNNGEPCFHPNYHYLLRST